MVFCLLLIGVDCCVLRVVCCVLMFVGCCMLVLLFRFGVLCVGVRLLFVVCLLCVVNRAL